MVDLVKIRKKAKEKKEGEAAAAVPPERAPAPPPEAELPPPSRSAQAPSPSQAMPSAAVAVQEPPKLARFLETAGQRHSMSAQVSVEGGPEQAELLTFVIAGEQYAIGIEQVVEIITPRPVTRVPNADESLVGILSLRGAIVTLVDVRRRLRHPPAGAGNADTRVIVVEHNGENVGFLVDRVLRVVKVSEGMVAPQPVVHTSEQDLSVRGVFRQGTALTILLDLESLLSNGTGL